MFLQSELSNNGPSLKSIALSFAKYISNEYEYSEVKSLMSTSSSTMQANLNHSHLLLKYSCSNFSLSIDSV